MEAFKSVGSHLFGAFTKSAITDIALQSEEDKRWSNFNYPPIIKLIHYSTQGLQQPYLTIVRVLNANVYLVVGIQLISLINCFAQVASDCDKIHGISVLYAFLSKLFSRVSFSIDVILWPMLAFFVFYKGYYAICKGPSHGTSLLLYYIASGIMILLWFVFTIIKSASFNGFTKLSVLKNCNLIFPLVLSVFEIVMYYISIGLSIFSLV